MRTSKRVREREQGLLPVTVIDKDISNRMASTIRHNRARGTHSVELMSNIVAELCRSDMSDAWIMKNIGMDRDELLRLKQITGLADLFANAEFSMSDEWEDECLRNKIGCISAETKQKLVVSVLFLLIICTIFARNNPKNVL